MSGGEIARADDGSVGHSLEEDVVAPLPCDEQQPPRKPEAFEAVLLEDALRRIIREELKSTAA